MVQEQVVSSEKTKKNDGINQDELSRQLKHCEWKEYLLKDIATINPKTGKLPKEFCYIDLESVQSGMLKNKKIIKNNEAPSRAQRVLQSNDILYQTVRPYQKNNLFFNFDDMEYVASTGYAQIRTNELCNPEFLYYLLHTEKFVNNVLVRCTGTSYPAINSNDLKKIKVKIPNLTIQNKIEKILISIDKKIGLLEKKHKNKIIFKEEFFNRYISNMEKEFQKYKLESLISISNERNKNNKDVQVLSISNKLGFISQEEQFEDRIVASSDTKNYKIVKKGFFAYNPARINVGSIARLKDFDEGIISPMYIVFRLDEKQINPIFFENYLSTNYFKLEILKRLEGSVRLILSADSLKNIEISVPNMEEQDKISTFLNNLSKDIDLSKKELNNFKEFKKALLQKMFI